MVLKFAKENLKELADELDSLRSENKMLKKQLAYTQEELNEYHTAEQEREEQEQKEQKQFNIDNILVKTDPVTGIRITFNQILYKDISYEQIIFITFVQLDYCGARLVDFGFSSNEPSIDEIFEAVCLYGNKNK